MSESSTDVIVVGAGPVGLSLANLLGMRGVRVTVLEALPSLIDYPRGVGIDDESLRSLQTMGLVHDALPFTTPAHIMRLVNGRGRTITEIRPTTTEFGWSRRNAFSQPDVDKVLLTGLDRFPSVDVRFGHDVSDIHEEPGAVRVSGKTLDGEPFEFTGGYLVGTDGGRSRVRKHIGVSFEGKSPSTRWLVVDVRNDPIGTPNIYLGGDPARPYVSLGLPQAVRRFEFMLFDNEPDSLVEDPEFVARLLSSHVPDPHSLDYIRRRVYTHHSRVAGSFRRGRILIAGDAAHLMPVWQGQGWNSGERDATNLAWKLAAVVRGESEPALLDSYDVERRDHSKAMVDLSTAFGRVVKPTNRLVAAARDGGAAILNRVPSVRDYFAQMKYKPMPRYEAGVVVDAVTLQPGISSPRVATRLHVGRSAPDRRSPVGMQFIQPIVDRDGQELLLDDAVGYRWAVLEWGGNPERSFSPSQRELARRLGAALVSVRPMVQTHIDLPADPDALVLGDPTGALKRWFDSRATSVLVLRPDRFVAAAGIAQQTGRLLEAVARAVRLRSVDDDARAGATARIQPASGSGRKAAAR